MTTDPGMMSSPSRNEEKGIALRVLRPPKGLGAVLMDREAAQRWLVVAVVGLAIIRRVTLVASLVKRFGKPRRSIDERAADE